MRIRITGITGLRNRGVEALLVPTLLSLLERFPAAQVDVGTWSVDYDRTRFEHPRVRFVQAPPFPAPGGGSRWVRLRLALRGGKQWVAQRLGLVEDPSGVTSAVDLVIAMGGDVFSSEYGTPSLKYHLRPLERAVQLGIPVAFLAHSIGPFREQEQADMWVKVARQAILVTVRESRSLEYVENSLKVRAYLVADPGMLLEPNQVLLRQLVRTGDGGGMRTPMVAISISQGIAGWVGTEQAKHFQAWKVIMLRMLTEWKVRLLLISHVQEPYGDDRIAATNLWRLLDYDPRVELATGDFSASEFKAMISQCDLLVAERMHAAVAGLSTGVCTVAISYSVKARGIMESLVGPGYVEKCVMPLERLLQPEESFKVLDEVWHLRAEIAAKLRESGRPTAVAAARNFELLADAWAKQGSPRSGHDG